MKHVVLPLFLIVTLLLSACSAMPSNTIKIGLEGPMTGDYAQEGQGFEKALKLLVDQANAAGGINRQKVELLVEDDKGDPKEASLVADRLASKKIMAVISRRTTPAPPNRPPPSTIARTSCNITPSSTATRLTQKGYQNFFRTAFLDDRQGLFAADYLTKVQNAKNIAVLHDNSTYAQGLAESTKKYLEERGAKVVFYDRSRA